MHFFFCGIGGSGMSALAQFLQHSGEQVSGSDRGFDRGQSLELQAKLKSQGIRLCPQDGSGVDSETILVASTAIEDSIPDVKQAKLLGCPILHRAKVLADYFNLQAGIAVAGTSGKSSTTALVGHVLHELGLSPTVINGAIMPGFVTEKMVGNALLGSGELMVVEADESDGSLINYKPQIGVITNISKDHMTLDELYQLFSKFAEHSQRVILNLDCELIKNVKIPAGKEVFTFSTINPSADLYVKSIEKTSSGVAFSINQTTFELPMVGLHNVENALVAISVALILGHSLQELSSVFENFKGVSRRMQRIGEARGVRVIDDFAHNPDKIRAVLQAVKQEKGRVIAFFQPHGFKPVKFMKDEFIASFYENTTSDDIIIMSEIFYAGGSADQSISSRVLTDELCRLGRNAIYCELRSTVADQISALAKSDDTVLLLGARDPSLKAFAVEVFEKI
ncbi:MAG: UDP-N-acetylmuramate--L-alanine ligase [Lentisphaeria bacterium]|nr:UDP-N-acetylmuramate--L-alanine ligase [Lentisphaeria bacterium]